MVVSTDAVEAILEAILAERPDLKLHGFGIKLTALSSDRVRRARYSADSTAWSFHARKQGRNANDQREAMRYCERVERQPVQLWLRPDAGEPAVQRPLGFSHVRAREGVLQRHLERQLRLQTRQPEVQGARPPDLAVPAPPSRT